GQSHCSHGRAQYECRGGDCRHDYRPPAWPCDRGWHLCRGIEKFARDRGIYGLRGSRAAGCARMTAELLRVRGLHAFYGESHILHGLDFEVNRAEVVALLGRNGAGRTTTLRALLGLVGRRTGSILIDGCEVIALPPHRVARLGVGYCPEERGIYSSLSAEENLLLPPVVGPGGMSVEEIYSLFPNLRDRGRTQGTRLSG